MILALLLAVPVVVVWGTLPLLRGAENERGLRSGDPVRVVVAMQRMLASGEAYELDALRRHDAAHDDVALDVERRVGAFVHGDQVYSVDVSPPGFVSTGESGLSDEELLAALTGAGAMDTTGTVASFGPGHAVAAVHCVRTARTSHFVVEPRDDGDPFGQLIYVFEAGAQVSNGWYDVSDDELARWRRDPDWPRGW